MTARNVAELRFTRGRQAAVFFFAALVALCVAAALYLLALPGWNRTLPPVLPSGWFALIPLPLATAAAWTGIHLARHAYIVFSTLGIELYPFWFPSRNSQVLFWPGIEGLTIEGGGRTLVIRLPEMRAIFVSLAPLTQSSRGLLARTVSGLEEQRKIAGIQSQTDLPLS